MGATAQSALALAVVPFAADDAITESLLIHLLSGISDVIQDEGVQLVGGHTCEGLELACGLSVQGYTENPNKLLRKRGGRVGDKIVLTKPLGTGALFAADMRAQCRGDQPLESIGAVLNIQDMAFLKGGLQASSNGIFSTLQPQNQRNRRAVINHADAAKAHPVTYPLLFDPQTAGGLIFFVDPNSCNDFVAKLQETYASAAVIGELVKYPENASATAGGVCPIGSGVSTGQRVRIAL
ncbi:Selenide, water dikinase [Seminavis robusta]|uniref:Selenide, water dikinase n=1 Tax=Seminavis robusta TaxID=568900 RepID=A0A9N8E7D4_9STRA|nr:Selenide, water dikinase [Seminavis robusta]|eukprot:Sro699_g189480.1 Selenide, water dikinase (238) ;mRNA; f:34563-35445